MASVQTVSILITDLVESTRLESRVGRAAADELRREYFSLLREAITECGGEEVKNQGDGLMVAFRSGGAAVTCAVSMQQRLERRNRGAEEELLVRIGLSLGDATAEEDDYFGRPVTEAARLCDKADAGQILASDLVQVMGSREGHRFDPVGEFHLKGIAEPVAVHEASWQPAGPEKYGFPLQHQLRGVPPSAFVGRTEERARLSKLLERAEAGTLHFAFVSGEPGIGKTRLSTHIVLEAYAKGATVLFGRCEEDLRVPYRPWVETLRYYIGNAPEDVLERYVERSGGEVARLAPELSRRLPHAPPPQDTDPETERYLLFGSVASLLEEAGRSKPVVLLLDDLHCADKPSLSLLRYLALSGLQAALLIVGTYRDSDLTRGHPLTELLADLRSVTGVERIPLKGLEEGEVVELMEATAGHDMDETGLALAKEITRESDGNPFFVAELLRHLGEAGTIQRAESGRWVLSDRVTDLGLPQSLREVIGHRVERVGGVGHAVLQTAAVIGHDFDLDLLLRTCDQGEDELLKILERAVQASLLLEPGQPVGRFSFAHALISHTLYEEVGPTRRARLHRRIAEALELLLGDDPGERVGELARHWACAITPAESGKAADYCRRAGERALAGIAPDEALRWFAQALELSEENADVDPANRCDMLIGLGDAQRQVGDGASRETLLEAARLASGLRDGERLAQATLANSRGFVSTAGQVDEERVAALEQALELVEEPSTRAALLSLLATELMYGAPLERRLKLTGEALRLARESGDRTAVAWSLARRFIATTAPETNDGLLEETEELLQLADELNDPVLQFWACNWRGLIATQAGDIDELARCTAREADLARCVGQPLLVWVSLWAEASRLALAGRIEEAEATVEHAAEVGSEAGQPDVLTIYVAQLILIRYEQGHLEEFEEPLRMAMEEAPGIPAFGAWLTLVCCELGRLEEGRSLLERFGAKRFADVPRDISTSAALAVFAESAAQVGELDAAASLHEQLLPYKGRLTFSALTSWGAVDLYLARLTATLGQYDDAERHFADAAAIHERIGAPTWLARTRFRWAEMLLDRGTLGDAERGRELAGHALGTARELSLGGLERRASALLQTPLGRT